MRRLLAFISVFVLLPAAAAHARTSLVEVPASGPQTVAALERLGLDVTHDVTDQRVRVLVYSDAERERLAAAGLPGREVIADVEAYRRRARQIDATRAATGPRSNLPSGRESYRVLADYYAELNAVEQAHPGLVRRVDLPRRSVQDRALAGVEIAADVNRTDDGRPVYVVMGAHHAREWPSAEVSMEFALDLAAGYGTDPRIKTLLDTVRVYVFPVINPDGFVISRGEDPLLPFGANENQRKNANEVDLNRNYGAFWGGNGASTDPARETYRGSGPWSEPESAAVHEFSQRLHITNFQSIHNIAALVLRPPGFRALGLAPDEARLKLLGDRMGAATGYSSQYGYQLYEVTGATEDWNYVAQNAFGYTVELGGGADFQGTYQTHVVRQYLGSDLSPAGNDGVREALLLAGEQAGDVQDHSVLSGSAPAGAKLRLRKSFTTITSPVCQGMSYAGGNSPCPSPGPIQLLPDLLDTELTAPASGHYEWHVTPSTRPFERKAGRTEAWTLRCETAGGALLAERQITIEIGEQLDGDPCTPGSTFRRIRPVSAPAPAPAAPAPSAPEAPAAPPVSSTPPPALRLSVAGVSRQRRATILRRGVLVRATCAVDCTLGTSVRRSHAGRAGSSALGSVLGSRTLSLRAGRRVAFRVKLSRAARRYLVRRDVERIVVRLDARSGPARRVASRGVTLVTR